jgi:peroxiredoxin Q/BCP
MAKLDLGDRMPAFALPDARGKIVRSDELLGQGPIVVYFYPKDDTPVCTKEACGFRDRHPDFLAGEAIVVGISADAPESHRRFAARHELPFLLLSDGDGEVARRFGVETFLGFLKGRETFVMDKDGVVRGRIKARFSADRHVEEALTLVRALSGRDAAAAPPP